MAHIDYDRASGTVTLTIEPDVSAFTEAADRAYRNLRAMQARIDGMPYLADLIWWQHGRQIVRDGMADVLEWLGEKP